MAAEQGHPSKAAVEGGDSVDPVERGHSRPGPAVERITIPRELVSDFEAFLARHGWELRRGQLGLSAQRVSRPGGAYDGQDEPSDDPGDVARGVRS